MWMCVSTPSGRSLIVTLSLSCPCEVVTVGAEAAAASAASIAWMLLPSMVKLWQWIYDEPL
jgi:hypothetical protein